MFCSVFKKSFYSLKDKRLYVYIYSMKPSVKIYSIVFLSFFIGFYSFAQFPSDFYLKTGSTDVGQLSSWTDDPAGGPVTQASNTPLSFTYAAKTWHIKNNAVATLSANLSANPNLIPATSTVLVESNCELLITGAGRISTCLLDAQSNATVTIDNSRKYKPNNIHSASVFSLIATNEIF